MAKDQGKDIRSKDPNIDRRRRGNFRVGWAHVANRTRIYEERDGITWQSVGNRCGAIVGLMRDDGGSNV